MKNKLRNWLSILSVGVVLLSTGCSNQKMNNLTSPSSALVFSSSVQSPQSSSVYMLQDTALSAGDTLAVDVVAKDVSNVFGASFDVDFDSSKITYAGYVAGNFLGSGVNTFAEIQQGSTNKVIVGASRTSGTVSGSGAIITLKFKVTGNSPLAFSNEKLKDSNNQPISGISWSGGTVAVQ